MRQLLFLGGSLLAEIFLVIIVSFWTHLIFGYIHLLSVPGAEFLHHKVFGQSSKFIFGYFPVLWFLLGIETLNASAASSAVGFASILALICQFIRCLAKIVSIANHRSVSWNPCLLQSSLSLRRIFLPGCPSIQDILLRSRILSSGYSKEKRNAWR